MFLAFSFGASAATRGETCLTLRFIFVFLNQQGRYANRPKDPYIYCTATLAPDAILAILYAE
jgi:hypothetical protein